MTKNVFKLAAATLLIAATAACTGSGEKGVPSPETSSSPSSSGVSTALPKRPSELKLDGVDPCKLLTSVQMGQIKVAEAKSDQIEVGDLGKSPGCFYKNGLQYAYTVVLVKNKSVESWLDGGGNMTAKVVDVAGFGAAELTFTGTKSVDCTIAVDVADGQQLHMTYTPTTKKGETQEEMCGNVKKAALLAVETLKTLK